MMNETQHAQQDAKVADGMRRTQRPAPNGSALPVGRPKGTANKVTRTIREAVEMAAAGCHPAGLAGWLIERAQGGVQDRQIFAGMVAKALPLQVHAQVNGGIRLELGRHVPDCRSGTAGRAGARGGRGPPRRCRWWQHHTHQPTSASPVAGL